MNRTRLERAENAIVEFRDKNKECFGKLMFLLYKYRDNYFNARRFSLKYRHLFRIIADRIREDDTSYKLYNSMKEDVDKIWREYKDVFDDFSTLVECHVDMGSNGYNALARLMYGESVDNILKETIDEEAQRQEHRYDIINKFLGIYHDNYDDHFSKDASKNFFITNLIIQSKTLDDETLHQILLDAHYLSKLDFCKDSTMDIKRTISLNSDLINVKNEDVQLVTMEKSEIADSVLNHPNYKEEVIHLEETVSEMLEEIDILESKSNDIYSKQKALLAAGDKGNSTELITYSNIQRGNSKKIIEIESAIECPYFGRVDYREDDSNKSESLYIGKAGFKQGSQNGVIDWRMPIASVFYECENGRAKYEAPGGTFCGDVKLKRQYTIKDSQLIALVDDVMSERIAKAIDKANSKVQSEIKDDVISDPILLERLKQNSDKKLKDIIETIRSEQNKIIRQPFHKLLVVQGVAGSGKTTVGLHRISYLLYNNKGIKSEKILVIAPNKVFLDYISELLPGIDVNGVTQSTFEQLAFQIIGTDLKISKDEKVEFFVSAAHENLYQFLKNAITNISKFKGSLAFINLIEYIVNKKANEIINDLKDISLFGERLKINRDEQIKYIKGNAPLNNKIITLKSALESKVKAYIEQQAFFTDNIDDLKKEASTFLSNYLKNRNRMEVVPIYKELFEDDNVYKILYKNRYFSFAAQYTLKIIENGYVEREDLAALSYIKYMIDGISSTSKYLHIFVDEAQDLSPLEFKVLKLISENNSMTIMGDMNQGVNSYRGIDNWEQLTNEIYSDLKPQYFELLNSYRSTKDIVKFSNRLIPVNLPKAKPVARSGDNPTLEKVTSYKDGINKVIKMVKYFKNKGCQSIGVLAKREKECKTIYSAITKIGQGLGNISLIDDSTTKYSGGISVAPIVLSKGLEFDAVILWNASNEVFSETDFDLKILYVALTRPMHYLHILYKGDITPHLKDFVKDETELIKLHMETANDNIDKMYKEFIECPEYKVITKKSPNLIPLITRLYNSINENGIHAYPVFRKEHNSQSQYRVFNFKILNAKRMDWNNVATVVPNHSGLKVFTFHDSEAGQSYLINETTINDENVIQTLIEEIKNVYKLRVST